LNRQEVKAFLNIPTNIRVDEYEMERYVLGSTRELILGYTKLLGETLFENKKILKQKKF
jgi:hypothetical protein